MRHDEVLAAAGMYYGLVYGKSGEKAFLASLGVELGDYDDARGCFYASVTPDGFARLQEFSADFRAEVHFLPDERWRDQRDDPELSTEELLADQAYYNWWLNGPRADERAKKIDDIGSLLYCVNEELRRRAVIPAAYPDADNSFSLT